MKPILRTTLNGLVESVKDGKVTVLFELGLDILQQDYPADQFDQLPKPGDKVVAKVLLGLDVEEPVVAPPKPVVAATEPRPAPRPVPVPVAVVKPTKHKKSLLDEDDDILSGGDDN